jgi:hypothetical protein
VKKGMDTLARSMLALAPAGLALLRSSGQSRRRVAGAFVLAASGVAAVAGIRMMTQRRKLASIEQGRFARESEIDERIAESFPASDPVWQP